VLCDEDSNFGAADWDGRMAEQTTIRALISVRDTAEHTRRRKPWNRAFSTAALKGYEEILGRRVQQFVTMLEQRTGPVDLAEFISYFTCVFCFLRFSASDPLGIGSTS
jgi:cytochrome P450